MLTLSRVARVVGAAVLALVGLLAVAALAADRPGDLDPTFSGDGKVTTQLESNQPNDEANAVAIQGDGRIVAVGTGGDGAALARYLPNGSLDPSFGEAGLATVAGLNEFNGVAIQGDGGIVVAGRVRDIAGERMLIARMTPSGDLDQSFGDHGLRIVSIGAHATANAIALTQGGKIVVAGSGVGSSGVTEFAVVELTSGGGLDPSFANGGVKLISLGPFADATSVAIDRAGEITAGGDGGRGQGGSAFARLRPSGALDRSFSGDGRKVVHTTRTNYLKGIVLTPGGGLVSVGNVYRPPAGQFHTDLLLVRLRANGALKRSFGNHGRRRVDLNNKDWAGGVVRQSDGKLVVGAATTTTPARFDFAVLRFTARGRVDRSFSGNGRTITHFGRTPTSDSSLANALVMQPNGKIVLAGRAAERSSESTRFALARYKNDGRPG